MMAPTKPSAIALLLLVLNQCLAWTPTTDRASCQNDRLCLLSFVWCATEDPQAGMRGCAYPADAYPLYDRDTGSNPALLIDTTSYNISWANADAQYPVLVEWQLAGYSTGNRTIADPDVRATWAQNVTGANYLEVRFASLMSDFPTTGSNISYNEARGLAATTFNTIWISQPERPLPPGVSPSSTLPMGYYVDFSDQFAVADSGMGGYLDTQREIATRETNRPWRLGVSISVGLGFPLFMALAFFLGRKSGSKRASKGVSTSEKLSSSS